MKMRVRLTDVQREWAKRGKMQELVDGVKSEALEGSRSLVGFLTSDRKPLDSVLEPATAVKVGLQAGGESWSVDKSWLSWEESPNSRWKSQERSVPGVFGKKKGNLKAVKRLLSRN